MPKPEIRNVRISGTRLGVEDHGIMTATVHVRGEGWGAGFGGLVLDQVGKDDPKCRTSDGFGIIFIRTVLETVGVSNWEDLPGKYVRVVEPELGGTIKRLGHIMEERWCDIDEMLTKYYPEKKRA